MLSCAMVRMNCACMYCTNAVFLITLLYSKPAEGGRGDIGLLIHRFHLIRSYVAIPFGQNECVELGNSKN